MLRCFEPAGLAVRPDDDIGGFKFTWIARSPRSIAPDAIARMRSLISEVPTRVALEPRTRVRRMERLFELWAVPYPLSENALGSVGSVFT